jgi:predicted nucleotidyltransferase
MVTIRIATEKINRLIADLRAMGYSPSRAILFGSIAKGKSHPLSDVDVAIWDEKFTSCLPIDYECIANVLHRHPRIEVHTFHSSEDSNSNPFIEEIEKTGVEIPVLVSGKSPERHIIEIYSGDKSFLARNQ